MYKVNINETSHDIEFLKGEIYCDQQLLQLDLIALNEYLFHLIIDSKSYFIEIVNNDLRKKQIGLKVNGVFFEMVIQDKFDLLLEKLGMQQTGTDNHEEVKAPMPGLIVDVLVQEGQAVSKGDKLVILEAMKMENIIKSASDGIIESIPVEKGMNVEKNQVLIQF